MKPVTTVSTDRGSLILSSIFLIIVLMDEMKCDKKHQATTLKLLTAQKSYQLSRNRTKPRLWNGPRFPLIRKTLKGIKDLTRVLSSGGGNRSQETGMHRVRPHPLALDWERSTKNIFQMTRDSTERTSISLRLVDLERKRRDGNTHSRRAKRFFTNAGSELSVQYDDNIIEDEPMVNVTKIHHDALFKKYENGSNLRNNRSLPYDGRDEITKTMNTVKLNKQLFIPILQEMADNIVGNDNGIDAVCIVVKMPTRAIIKKVQPNGDIDSKGNLAQVKIATENYLRNSLDTNSFREELRDDEEIYPLQKSMSHSYDEKASSQCAHENTQNEHEYSNIFKQIKSMMVRANSYYSDMSMKVGNIYNEFLEVNGFKNEQF